MVSQVDRFPQPIFDVLRAEHKEVAGIMNAIAATGDESQAQRVALFEELYEALVAHARAEEDTLYVRLRGARETRDICLEAIQEHRIANLRLHELKEMTTHGDTWMAKFKVLKTNVEHHVKEEEAEMFPEARKLLTKTEQVQFAAAYLESKREHVASLG